MNNTTFTYSSDITKEQEERLQLLNFWINGVVTNIVVVLGLIGNVLTTVILSRRAMRSSTNYYLSALAVWDSIVLVCTCLLIGAVGVPRMHAYHQHAFAYVVSYVYPVALVAQTATIWLTVSFTVERYIAVCHPLRAAAMCTLARAKAVIGGVSVGAVLYNIPRWFDYYPAHKHHPTENSSIAVALRTAFSQNTVYLQVYFSWLYVPIMCIVPLLVLSVLNSCLVAAVRRSQKQRRDMNVRQSRENNVTIMLVCVVLVFLVCQVPALVYNLAYAVDNRYVENNYSYQVLSYFRNFLVSLNSAINFLLYCALGQKFRRIFVHTFLHRCVRDSYARMSGVYAHTTTSAYQLSVKRRAYGATKAPPLPKSGLSKFASNGTAAAAIGRHQGSACGCDMPPSAGGSTTTADVTLERLLPDRSRYHAKTPAKCRINGLADRTCTAT